MNRIRAWWKHCSDYSTTLEVLMLSLQSLSYRDVTCSRACGSHALSQTKVAGRRAHYYNDGLSLAYFILVAKHNLTQTH